MYLKALQNYAVFGGRARRSEYWYFFLFNMIFAIIIAVISGILTSPWLDNIYTLATLLPSIAVAVRRMHDVNKSGWFILIPFYNLILCCTDGTPGNNEYGSDPKRPEFDEFLQSEAPARA